jgi:hypothetical protein
MNVSLPAGSRNRRFKTEPAHNFLGIGVDALMGRCMRTHGNAVRFFEMSAVETAGGARQPLKRQPMLMDQEIDRQHYWISRAPYR